MVVGAGDDELVGLEVLVIDHLPRLGALHPQIVRHVLLAKDAADLGPDDAIDPVHGLQNSQMFKHAQNQFKPKARPPRPFARSAAASRSTRPSTCGVVLRVALPCASRLSATAPTSAEPTTTPSAMRGQRAHLVLGLHAETDRDRQIGMRLDAADMGANRADVGRRGAGDAGDRDVVDEPARIGENGRQALASVVGVARRMKFNPAAVAAGRSSASSSGGMSTTIRPSTPACTASAMKRSTGYTYMGL